MAQSEVHSITLEHRLTFWAPATNLTVRLEGLSEQSQKIWIFANSSKDTSNDCNFGSFMP